VRRTISLALVAGCVALGSLRMAAPAAPPPPPHTSPTTTPVQARDAAAPVMPQLKNPQAPAPEYPPPARDPFNFGNRPAPPRPGGTRADAPPIPAPPPPLPTLVAIISKPTDGGVLHTAVFGAGNGIAFANAGDAIGALILNDITPDSVVLLDPRTGASFGESIK
jgi:hypothetical protein